MPASLGQLLSTWDYHALYLLNVQWADPTLDHFWLVMTHLERQRWFLWGIVPILLAWLVYKYRTEAYKPLLAVALAVGAADLLSYRVIKNWVDRPRPFQNEEISSWVRHVGDAHGPSFPSNHAANCFAGAVVLAWYFQRQAKWFYAFAFLVAWSRPALGVHYPSDVVAGAILGFIVATMIKALVLNRFSFFHLRGNVSSLEKDSVALRLRSRRLN